MHWCILHLMHSYALLFTSSYFNGNMYSMQYIWDKMPFNLMKKNGLFSLLLHITPAKIILEINSPASVFYSAYLLIIFLHKNKSWKLQCHIFIIHHHHVSTPSPHDSTGYSLTRRTVFVDIQCNTRDFFLTLKYYVPIYITFYV